jgi:hypothetical protein
MLVDKVDTVPMREGEAFKRNHLQWLELLLCCLTCVPMRISATLTCFRELVSLQMYRIKFIPQYEFDWPSHRAECTL